MYQVVGFSLVSETPSMYFTVSLAAEMAHFRERGAFGAKKSPPAAGRFSACSAATGPPWHTPKLVRLAWRAADYPDHVIDTYGHPDADSLV